ncbi:Sporulation-specific N-acetylmuramoyl-L-alanine amidase [compost metagenome]
MKIANDLKADIFISVHGNSAAPTATGSETYYTRPDSIELAGVMHKYLVEATGLPDRKVRQKSLQVTRETKMPAVLLEVGYLSNKNDEPLMYDDAFQERVAEGIVAGIKEYLGLQ